MDQVAKANGGHKFIECLGTEYIALTSYVNWHTKVRLRHTICGFEWDQIPGELMRKGKRFSGTEVKDKPCPKCRGRVHRTAAYLRQEVIDLTEGEYEVVEDLQDDADVRVSQKVQMRHLACGHVWAVGVGFFVNNGNRCPKCAYVRNRHPSVDFEDYFEAHPEKRSQPTFLYVVEFEGNGEHFFKVGITTRTLEKRRLAEGTGYSYRPLFLLQTTFETAAKIEQEVLAENWDRRYTPKVKFCGMRECFPNNVTRMIQEKLNAKQLP